MTHRTENNVPFGRRPGGHFSFGFSWVTCVLLAILIGRPEAAAGQVTVQGRVLDATTAEPLIGANVFVVGTQEGTVTDFQGTFTLRTSAAYPFLVVCSYVGYGPDSIRVGHPGFLDVLLSASAVFQEAVVVGDRMTDRQRESPVRISSLDAVDMLQNPGSDISAGLALKPEIDLTTASLGFRIINTRGFNSTSPVRMLQLIDGVDNQSPGLNFSLGNFLGASELDLARVDVVVGPSAPLYGPNAFNGVILMETLDPFLHPGLRVSLKAGERFLQEGSARYAGVIADHSGRGRFAVKLNLSLLRAQDWVADNREPVSGSKAGRDNPGGYDAVNVYGDAYRERGDYDLLFGNKVLFAGLGTVHRNGYAESDLVGYRTRNLKAHAAFHWRLQPDRDLLSPELIAASSFSTGTTVYQGDNRFSLRDIRFFQHRVELRRRGHWFLRSYITHEDAGRSYDPYFTALRLQDASASYNLWINQYEQSWRSQVIPRMLELGYPYPVDGDCSASMAWLDAHADSLRGWHAGIRDLTNRQLGFYQPGTQRFDSLLAVITSTLNNEAGGTRFYDRSALWHTQGEYAIRWAGWPDLRVGATFRQYLPDSRGTIFSDTLGRQIRNREWGAYAGWQQRLLPDDRLLLSATVRVDKNANLRLIHTEAAGLVWKPGRDTYVRMSFSSGLRNPTLSDQYLYLNVGPAILAGHVDRVDELITLTSFDSARNSLNWQMLRYFSIDPIRPERVRTLEAGIRTRPAPRLSVDAGYYHNWYTDFLGYLIGIRADIPVQDPPPVFPRKVTVYRYSANSSTQVRTQGASLALAWEAGERIVLSGNFTWNELVKSDPDDPIIPAYNTPPRKYNLQIAGRDYPVLAGAWAARLGFLINYRHVSGYRFEGSPQFQGDIRPYGLVDAQCNLTLNAKPHWMLKIGATNLLDNLHDEVYGGPQIGRLAFVQLAASF